MKERCEAAAKRYELDVYVSGEAFVTQPGPLSTMVQEAVKAATGREPVLSTTGGTSDARFIHNYTPVVEFGLVGRTIHKVNECSAIADIRELTKIYGGILDRFFGAS
jgi:succinyl-diaminopimelate desuccinylase